MRHHDTPADTGRRDQARWIMALAEAMPFSTLYMVGSWSPPPQVRR